MLAESTDPTLFHGGQNGNRRVEPGEFVDHSRPDLCRFAIGPTGYGHHAAHGLHEEVVAGQFGTFPCAAKAGYRTRDEIRPPVGQRAPVEAEPGHCPNPEVIDHHVGP